VPSVTTVNDVLDKPALPWWGMKMGMNVALEALRRGELVWLNGEWQILVMGESEYVPATIDTMVEWAKFNRLTTNHVRDKGGERGTAAHNVFEAWASFGALAEPTGYPPEQEGYIHAALSFCQDAEIEDAEVEVMVGSLRHRFAGRYDLRGVLSGDLWLGTGPRAKRMTFDRVRSLIDFKSSKDIYTGHFLQLEAYEGASIECGYDPTVERVVVLVNTEGRYKVKTSDRTYDDFLAVRAAYDAVKRKDTDG
jgi:hypothetical protein